MKIKTESFAWGTSIGVHVVLLLLLAATGVFSMANHEPPDLTEVALYDVSGGEEDSGASDNAAEAGSAPEMEAAAEVTIPDAKAPQIEKKDEPQPTEQQKDKASQETKKAEAKANGSEHHEDHHKGDGNGAGEHHGNGNHHNDSGEGKGGGNGGKANANSTVPEVPPQLTYRAMPAYPENLRQQNVTGSVGVSFVVGADGSVTSATVDSSSGYPEMDAAALAAVYQYTFSPALNSAGQPVACGNHTNIHFALR